MPQVQFQKEIAANSFQSNGGIEWMIQTVKSDVKQISVATGTAGDKLGPSAVRTVCAKEAHRTQLLRADV